MLQLRLVMNGNRRGWLGMQKAHDLLYGIIVEIIGIFAHDDLTGSVHNELGSVSAVLFAFQQKEHGLLNDDCVCH